MPSLQPLTLKGSIIEPNLSASVGASTLKSRNWIDTFRDLHLNNRKAIKYWFWDNLNWSKQSLWIGKLKMTIDLPVQDSQISQYIQDLILDLNSHSHLRSQIFAKFYFSRNVDTQEPDINFLLLCNQSRLPEEFTLTKTHQCFEKYQLTEAIINQDADFRQIINHYLNWSNVYKYFNLVTEASY